MDERNFQKIVKFYFVVQRQPKLLLILRCPVQAPVDQKGIHQLQKLDIVPLIHQDLNPRLGISHECVRAHKHLRLLFQIHLFQYVSVILHEYELVHSIQKWSCL